MSQHPPLTETLDAEVATDASVGPAEGAVRLGRFLVLEVLGRGSMGVVYAAFDEALDRRVALKVIRRDAGPREAVRPRMLREAQALARLSHPNVVQVYEVGEIAGQVFIAMEYLQGRTLQEWLAERPRGWREILDVFVQAGRGLAAAHAAKLVHRDFKPKSRRPSQTAPQPTDRPHSRELGRFERVSLRRLAPRYPALPQILAKRWQWL